MTGEGLSARLRLGPYQLLRPLARGGMADIYLATRDGCPIGRQVALKVLDPQRAPDAETRAMFLDEARLLALLSHHNIATVLDVDVAESHLYLAMEYVHGVDLRNLLAACVRAGQRSLDLDAAVAIVIAAATGLDHAHRRTGPDGQPLDLVHRDVSLSNIMAGHDGTVKVVDFGIATTSIATVRTCPGTVRGKASYMSPEQCLGERVDRRTDVFALGVVLYELTCGIRCFAGKGDFDRMLAVVRGEYVRPTSIVPDYPPELETVIERALAIDVIDRYDSAADFAEALAEVARARGWATGTAPIARVMAERFGDAAGDAEAIEVPSELIVEEAAIHDVETMRTARGRLARGSNVDMLFAGLDEELLTRSRRKLRPRPPTAPVYLCDPAPARADRNSD
jgi:eukaryotic-like serine/threonine-protein kinase